MRCDDASGQLSAWIDGELSSEDAAALAVHLEQCDSCRAESEQLKDEDDALRRVFVERRAASAKLADKTVAALRNEFEMLRAAGAARPKLAWGQALMAMAAGFLLALILFRPWRVMPTEQVAMPAPEPIARLALATGPVEVKPWQQMEFFLCPSESPISKDATVRTGPSARCEIALDDGNAVRLDSDTEVTLHSNDVVEVSRGRLWSASEAGREGVAVQANGGKVVPKAAAEFAIACEPRGARVTVVEGEVEVETAARSMAVGPGEKVRIVDGDVEEDPSWRDALSETAWVNSVLALRDSEHPELVERLNRLLANVGAAKLSLLYEDELRRLGDDGVPPLLAYLQATRDTPETAQRAMAARIVADVAGVIRIKELIELLVDASGEVRFEAARGLERLTGRDQGITVEEWRTRSADESAKGQRAWKNWWEANRARYR